MSGVHEKALWLHTVAARPWWDGVDEEDVVFGEAGVPETECLVNTDVS